MTEIKKTAAATPKRAKKPTSTRTVKDVAQLQLMVDDDRVQPSLGSTGAAGIDLRLATSAAIAIAPGGMRVVGTGVRVAIPEGYVGKLYVRSSTGIKKRVTLANGTGIIDSDYRGEIKLALMNNGSKPVFFEQYDRVAQLVVCRHFDYRGMVFVDELPETERGEGGVGSTGDK